MGPLKGIHSRVIIVSPSVHVDPLWQTWKDFVKRHYDWADELEETLFDTYDEPALREIVDKHKRINQELKKRHKGKGKCKLFSLFMFFDDMASETELRDSRGLIAEIFLRHRHNFIQAVVSTRNGAQSRRQLVHSAAGSVSLACALQKRRKPSCKRFLPCTRTRK